MIHNFKNTESWEDKASSKLAIASWHRLPLPWFYSCYWRYL